MQTPISVQRDHFTAGMIVNEMRPERHGNAHLLFAVLFATNESNTPCKIVKFTNTKTDKDPKWQSKPQELNVTLDKEEADELKNSFLVKDKLILLVTTDYMLTVDFNGESAQITNAVHVKKMVYNERIDYFTCCRAGLPPSTNHLIAFNAYMQNSGGWEDVFNPLDLPNIYNSKKLGITGKYNSWVMKCSGIDYDKLEFVCKDPSKFSLLLRYEYVDSVFEFTENNLLMFADPVFLVAKNFIVIHTI